MDVESDVSLNEATAGAIPDGDDTRARGRDLVERHGDISPLRAGRPKIPLVDVAIVVGRMGIAAAEICFPRRAIVPPDQRGRVGRCN